MVQTEYTSQFQGKSNFPASRKIYQEGSQPSVRVPFRQVTLTPTTGRFGNEENAPLNIYDTSGPYSDPDASLDLRQGLPALRREWIMSRGDVEEYEGYGVPLRGKNVAQPFPGLTRKPLRGKPGKGPDADSLRTRGHRHPGDGVHRHPRGHRPRVRPGGNCPGPGHHSHPTSTTPSPSR